MAVILFRHLVQVPFLQQDLFNENNTSLIPSQLPAFPLFTPLAAAKID
jgi:hypothetical protein